MFYTLFLFPSILFSQNFFIEGGGCVNAPGIKSFYFSDGDSRSGNEWKGTVRSVPSYYFKVGFEKLFPLKNRIQTSLPFTISYFNVVEISEMDGGSWGCFVYSFGHKSIVSNIQTGAFSLGLKLIFDTHKKIQFTQVLILELGLLLLNEARLPFRQITLHTMMKKRIPSAMYR